MPKQSTDINGNPFGITYTAVGQKWTIDKGVDVFGATAGVYSTFASSKLVNSGHVSGGTLGVYFEMGGASGTYSIQNKASGEIDAVYAVYVSSFQGSLSIGNDGDIQGSQVGVYASNFQASLDFHNGGDVQGGLYGVYLADFLNSVSIENDGDIAGSQFGIFASGSTDVEVNNTGHVSGGQSAVFIAAGVAGAGGPVVDNHGKIESAQYGLYISGPSNIGAKLVNHEGGVIKGGAAAILDLSALNFKNEGKVQGLVLTSGYDDKIINKKVIKGDVLLASGDDTFKNKGNAKAGLIDTQDGNDLVVFGNKADKLLFDSTLNAATNIDTVKKFAAGKDAIYLDDDIFTTITPGTLSDAAFHKGTSAADADDRIIYDKASGALYYDPDGTGALAQTQFAKFDGGPNLKASDFTIGEYSITI